jgi:hypothetical protein
MWSVSILCRETITSQCSNPMLRSRSEKRGSERRRAVIEVNAFGDLLPGVFWQGQETYAAELRAMVGAVTR